MYYVYAISSTARKYIYVGITNNLNRRFSQHQNGKERTTAPYRPFRIILREERATRIEARQREKYLKSGIGKKWLKKK
ncbi:MAG: GIY-YIG nuclease family protein [bacterium]|nr:GIY-YIG nuclease family protein [bacterium]